MEIRQESWYYTVFAFESQRKRKLWVLEKLSYLSSESIEERQGHLRIFIYKRNVMWDDCGLKSQLTRLLELISSQVEQMLVMEATGGCREIDRLKSYDDQ